MYYFCRHFGFSRRLAILHLSTVAGPTFVLILLTGLFVLFSRQRSRGVVRLIVGSAYAGWTIVLALLYGAHFAGNSLWGNNVNYQIVSHFLLRRRLQEYDGVSLSSWVYVVLALAATTIAIVHFVLSKQILEGLEHVF